MIRPGATRRSLILLALVACACDVPVAAGLEEGEASQAVVALEASGIAAEKERDPEDENGFRVMVARDDASSALGALAAEGLPKRPTPGVLDALGKGSLVPSRLSEHAKLVAGVSGELERSLRGVHGVIAARVHLAVPPRDPLALGESAPGASASVLIRHRGAAPPIAANEVQRLVAGAVPGLAEAAVSVVMTPAPPRARLPERELSRVGPLTVARTSIVPLKILIGVAVLLNVLLVGGVVLLWSRLRRAEAALAQEQSADATRPQAA